MTIAGVIPTAELNFQVELIPAAFAQAYISGLKNKLEALDGPEIHLVHDMETNTSDCMISELEEALLNGLSIAELRVFKVLDLCLKNNVNFRIWCANNDINACVNHCVEVNDMASTLEAISVGSGAFWHAR